MKRNKYVSTTIVKKYYYGLAVPTQRVKERDRTKNSSSHTRLHTHFIKLSQKMAQANAFFFFKVLFFFLLLLFLLLLAFLIFGFFFFFILVLLLLLFFSLSFHLQAINNLECKNSNTMLVIMAVVVNFVVIIVVVHNFCCYEFFLFVCMHLCVFVCVRRLWNLTNDYYNSMQSNKE